MSRWIRGGAWALALLLPAMIWAGGFWLSIKSPANPEVKDAVLVLQAEGCHDPAHATVTGTAEGLVNGKRQSIPLTLTATSQPGTYAVRKQWPDGGTWVLAFAGFNQGAHTSTLVQLGPDAKLRPASAPSKGIRMMPGKISKAEIETALGNGS